MTWTPHLMFLLVVHGINAHLFNAHLQAIE